MKLDYQITELLYPHHEKDWSGCVYSHINWTIWISNAVLLKDINEHFNLDIQLETKTEIDEDTAIHAYHYIQNQKKYCGTFGSEYLK